MNIEIDNICEIYTTNENAFSVGVKCYENSKWFVFYNIDPKGVIDGYFVVKKSQVRKKQQNTSYLKMIKMFMLYSDTHSYSKWFSLKKITFRNDIIDQILALSENDGSIITIKSNKDNIIYEGYISVDKDTIHMKCINISNALILESVDLQKDDIEYIAFLTLDQKLLDYAHRKLSESTGVGC